MGNYWMTAGHRRSQGEEAVVLSCTYKPRQYAYFTFYAHIIQVHNSQQRAKIPIIVPIFGIIFNVLYSSSIYSTK